MCFGWIDGQRKGLDDTHYLQKFTPRRARSKWSQINVGRCGELIEAGRMRPAGQAEIDAAKADGRWDAAYAPASKIEVPPDLVEAIEAAGVDGRVRGAQEPGPLLDPVPPPRRQAAGDARPADREVVDELELTDDFEVAAPQALERAQRVVVPARVAARR